MHLKPLQHGHSDALLPSHQNIPASRRPGELRPGQRIRNRHHGQPRWLHRYSMVLEQSMSQQP